MKWIMYVARCSDNSLYTGITTDVARRIHEHNHSKRGAKYTRSRRPVILAYTKEYATRSEALIAESSFKKLNKTQKELIVS